LYRYYPVANLTRTRQAVLIEPLRPEKFYVKTFNATSLYILSICEVCGSYQCPYCPFYSGGPARAAPALGPLALVLLLVMAHALLGGRRSLGDGGERTIIVGFTRWSGPN
jgi:hypothetical protein